MDIEKFKIIDEIINISINDGIIVTGAQVPKEAKMFDFHFPNHPILPGVILIECMAQSAGQLTMARSNFSKMAVLAKVASCKFSSFVLPGEKIICEVQMKNSNNEFSLCNCTIRSTTQEKIVCSAEIRMKTIDFPSRSAEKILTSNFAELSAGMEL